MWEQEAGAREQAFSSAGGKGPELSVGYLGGRKKPNSGEQQLPQVFKVYQQVFV